jgi:hypothetical protein
MAERATRSLTIAVTLLLAQPACVSVVSTFSSDDRIVERRVMFDQLGPTQYEVSSAAQEDGSGNERAKTAAHLSAAHLSAANVEGEVTRYQHCRRLDIAVNEHTETYRKRPTSHLRVVLGALVGAAGASLLALGIRDKARGEPFRENGEVTAAGSKFYLGAIGSVFLLDAVRVAVQSVDESDTLRSENPSVSAARCHPGVAVGTTLALLSSGALVATARTDETGHYRLAVPLEPLANADAPPSLLVESSTVPAPAALLSLWRTARSRSAADQASAARASSGATSITSREAVLLSGVQLENADRAVLEAALAHAGALRLPEATSKGISIFDASALSVPGMQRLKVMFDASDHFVQAKYEGSVSSEEDARLRAELQALYGPPRSSEARNLEPAELAWVFAEGLEIVYRRAALGTLAAAPASLLYIDRPAERTLRETLARESPASP